MPYIKCVICGKKEWVCLDCDKESAELQDERKPEPDERPRKRIKDKPMKKLGGRKAMLQAARDYVAEHPGTKFYTALAIVTGKRKEQPVKAKWKEQRRKVDSDFDEAPPEEPED